MSKVALTVWDGRVSPVFDVCQRASVFELVDGAIVATTEADLDTATPLAKVERLVELGVETLVCGAISETVRAEAVSRGLEVIGFVAGPVEEVAQAVAAGALPSPALSMPGCRGRGGGRGRGRGRGRGPGRGGGQGRGGQGRGGQGRGGQGRGGQGRGGQGRGGQGRGGWGRGGGQGRGGGSGRGRRDDSKRGGDPL